MVETLPPPVSLDCALALDGTSIISPSVSNSPLGQVLVDAPVGGLSREDSPPSDTVGEESKIGLV